MNRSQLDDMHPVVGLIKDWLGFGEINISEEATFALEESLRNLEKKTHPGMQEKKCEACGCTYYVERSKSVKSRFCSKFCHIKNLRRISRSRYKEQGFNFGKNS